MRSHAFEARVPLARRQLLHEPRKLGLAVIGTVALVGLLLGLREGIGRQVAGAMFATAIIALAMFWLGSIASGPTLGLDMVPMVPAMLLAMFYRVDEHSESHPVKRRVRERWLTDEGGAMNDGLVTALGEPR